MIFWRGWGILAFLAIGVSVGLTALFAMLTGTDMNRVSWQGIPAFFIVGTVLFYLGRQLNVTGPTKKLAALLTEHNTEVNTPAMTVISLNPQEPIFTDEGLALLKRVKNRHTLFFIPMQWWGFVLPLIGIAMSIASLNSSN